MPFAQVFAFLDLSILIYKIRDLSEMLSGALDLMDPAVKVWLFWVLGEISHFLRNMGFDLKNWERDLYHNEKVILSPFEGCTALLLPKFKTSSP